MALTMVVVVLTALLVIAVPFILSVRNQQRGSRARRDAAQARLLAESAADHAAVLLQDGHEAVERAGGGFATPAYDDRSELWLDRGLTVAELGGLLSGRSLAQGGALLSARAEDEAGKINLNTATPWTLGNLIGSAMLALPLDETLSPGGSFWVDDTADLEAEGYAWLSAGRGGGALPSAEVLAYRVTGKRNAQGFPELQVVARALVQNQEFGPPRTHPAGTLLVDLRAWKICRHRLGGGPGGPPDQLVWYDSVADVKNIALWDAVPGGPYPDGEALRRDQYQRLARHATVSSGFADGNVWVNLQRAAGVFTNPDEPAVPTAVNSGDGSRYTAGAVVRVGRGGRTYYATVSHARPSGVILDRRLPDFGPQEALVETLQRHAVNVNTAPRPVLFALLYGLRLRNGIVTRAAAKLLADALLARTLPDAASGSLSPFVDQRDLRDYLQSLTWPPALVTADMLQAVAANATSPANAQLWVASHPFAFAGQDVYTIEADAVLSNAAGDQTAAHRLTRLVQVGPPGDDRLACETWEDFERSRLLPVGNGFTLDAVRPPAYVRVRTGETQDAKDGDEVAGPTLVLPVARSQCGSFQFWAQALDGLAREAPAYLFDGGDAPERNRMALLYDPRAPNADGSQGALIFQVFDPALERSAWEYRYPLPPGSSLLFKPNHWYHLQPVWGAMRRQGADRAFADRALGGPSGQRKIDEYWHRFGLGLLIDGQPSFADQAVAGVLQLTHYDDLGMATRLSGRLAQALDATAGTQAGSPATLAFYEAPPDLCGLYGSPTTPVRLGDEVLIVDDRWRVVQRGARRQPWNLVRAPEYHPEGVLAVPWGYEELLGGLGLAAGNGVLTSPLGTDLVKEMIATTRHPAGKIPGLLDDATDLPLADTSGLQDTGWVAIVGPGLDPGWTPPADPPGPIPPPPAPPYTDEEKAEISLRVRAEVVYYRAKTATSLQLEARANPGFYRSGWTFVVPLSVAVEADGARTLVYDDPASDSGAVNFLQLITRDADRDFEWVRYETIDQDHEPRWHFTNAAFGASLQVTVGRTLQTEHLAALRAAGLPPSVMAPRPTPPAPPQTASTLDQYDRLLIGDQATIDDPNTIWGTVAAGPLFWRRRENTPLLAHPQGRLVTPVFRTAGAQAGRFDRVTLADPQRQSLEAHVLNWEARRQENPWAGQRPPPPHYNNDYLLAALRRFAGEDSGLDRYDAGSFLWKFPTGMLPDAQTDDQRLLFGGAALAAGPVASQRWRLDLTEAQTRAGSTGLVQHPATADNALTNKQVIPILSGAAIEASELQAGALLPQRPGGQRWFGPSATPDNGIVFLEDEVFAWGDAGGQRVLTRGWRGALQNGHARETLGLVLPEAMRPVSVLQSDDGTTPRLADARRFGAAGEAGGVALIDDPNGEELVSFTRATNDTLFFPAIDAAEVAAFRGRFGTRARRHPADTLVFDWPYRYQDRYAPRCHAPEMVYFQTAFARTNAQWLELQVACTNDADLRTLLGPGYFNDPADERDPRLWIVCRFDGAPGWDSARVIDAPDPPEPDALYRMPYHFLRTLPPALGGSALPADEEPVAGDRTFAFPLDVQADTLEVRIYFPQPFDAFRRDAWKWSPRLTRVAALFRQRTQTLAQWNAR